MADMADRAALRNLGLALSCAGVGVLLLAAAAVTQHRDGSSQPDTGYLVAGPAANTDGQSDARLTR